MKKKLIIMITALALICSVAVIGTIAYLVDKTQAVENTFTAGNVDITLTESDADNDNDANANEYKMIPGNTIEKDPEVTVESGSEACWLFIKVEKTNDPDTYLSYSIDSTYWAPLNDSDSDGVADDGVYYYKGTELDELLTSDKTYPILEGNEVVVRTSLTKAQMDALKTSGKYPKLTFTAYAIQKANVSNVSTAWAEIGKQ